MDDRPWLAPLAEWCASTAPADVADALRERLAAATLDWFGAYAAGRSEPDAGAFLTAVARTGEDGPAQQAFLLGALSHLAEVDDGHGAAMMHPGVTAFSPVAALAARDGLCLGVFRAAIVAGYEVGVRCGAAFGPEHYRVFHTTATAGSFGAAAATAVVLGLDADRTLSAFGHAGAQATGVWQFQSDGADGVKGAHCGFAARNGLIAAHLAAAGLAGTRRVLEGARGLAAAWKTRIDPDPLARPFSADRSALATSTVKAWPVCGQMHHVLDAVLELTETERVASQAEEIVVTSFSALERIAGARDPQTPAQARFSTSYCVAHVLAHGGMSLDALNGRTLPNDELVGALARKVRLVSDARHDAEYPGRRRCEISVRLRDGRELSVRHEGRRGDPDRPIGKDEMDQRFEDVSRGAPEAWRAAVRAFCRKVETGDDAEWLTPGGFKGLLHV